MSSHPLQIPKQPQTLQNHQTQSENIQNNNKTSKPIISYNKWTRDQDILYVRFLKGNLERMKKKLFRKAYNKFKKMSEYVSTKDSFQCRSHHQKLIKKHSTIQTIIEKLTIKNAQIIKKRPKQLKDENKIKLTPQIFEKGSFQELGKTPTQKKPTEDKEQKEINSRVQFFIPQQKQVQNKTNSKVNSFQTVSASKNGFQEIAYTGIGEINKMKYNIKDDNFNCPQIKNVEPTCREGRTVSDQKQMQNRQLYYKQVYQNSQKVYNHQCQCHCECMQLNRNQNHPNFQTPFRHPSLLHQYGPSYSTHPHYYGLPYLYNHPQYPLLPYHPPYHDIVHYSTYPTYTNPKIYQQIVKVQVKQQE